MTNNTITKDIDFLDHGYSVTIVPMVFYYFAYIPEFGYSTCSNTGSTIQEVLVNLNMTYIDIKKYYKMKGRSIPEPSEKTFI